MPILNLVRENKVDTSLSLCEHTGIGFPVFLLLVAQAAEQPPWASCPGLEEARPHR